MCVRERRKKYEKEIRRIEVQVSTKHATSPPHRVESRELRGRERLHGPHRRILSGGKYVECVTVRLCLHVVRYETEANMGTTAFRTMKVLYWHF